MENLSSAFDQPLGKRRLVFADRQTLILPALRHHIHLQSLEVLNFKLNIKFETCRTDCLHLMITDPEQNEHAKRA